MYALIVFTVQLVAISNSDRRAGVGYAPVHFLHTRMQRGSSLSLSSGLYSPPRLVFIGRFDSFLFYDSPLLHRANKLPWLIQQEWV